MRERERYGKRVGALIDGRWRLDSLLGWGSTSAVYAATHRNGHRAALKIIHQSLCSDSSMVERFLREAGIANAIKHRAIVPINDDGITEEGCAYLVLELLEGETLEERRARKGGCISLEEFASIAEELMSAIAAVHAAGIIHRDLKPGNVFITKTGELKLLDFGTARIFDRAPGSTASVVGLVIGTPAFMSPEQARGSRAEVDAQSDVWSLGAMIFTVLSGDYVHVGRDQHARLLAAASKPARTIVSAMPSIDERVADVVDRALAYPKRDRWPDVQSMRVAFRTAIVTSMPTMRDLKAFDDVMAPEPGDSTSAVTSTVDGPSTPSLEIDAAAPTTMDDASSAPLMLAEVATPGLPKEEPVHSESETPPVSSTQFRPARARGIPLAALVTGLLTVAAMVALVTFFVAGGDQPTRGAASVATQAPVDTAPASAEPVVPVPLAAPASSFIVISAPDEPAPPQKGSASSVIVRPKVALPVPPAPPAIPLVMAPEPPKPEPAALPATPVENKSEGKSEAAALAPMPWPAPASATSESAADAGVGAGGSVTNEPTPKGGAAPSANGEPAP